MIESAFTQGHNMVNGGLRQPGPDGFVQALELCWLGGSAVTLVPRSERDQAAADAISNAAANAGAPLNLSVQDWDDLFRAIQERLRHIVGDRNTDMAPLEMHDMGVSIQDGVLECVAALDQLHAALGLERERVSANGKLVDRHVKS